MVDPFPGVPYSFGALRKTFGPLWVRCDVCRRYARLFLRELRDVDYRTKTFSCSIVAPTARSRSRSPAKTPGWRITASISAWIRSTTLLPSNE
jgi:hypothetical protein